VVYTPFVKAVVQPAISKREIDDVVRFRFLAEHGHRLATDRYYSRFLGLTTETSFQPVQTTVRYHTLRSQLCALADSVPEAKDWIGSAWEYRSFLDDALSTAAPGHEYRRSA